MTTGNVRTPLYGAECYLRMVLEFDTYYTYKDVITELTDVGVNFYDAIEYVDSIILKGCTITWATPDCARNPPGWLTRPI